MSLVNEVGVLVDERGQLFIEKVSSEKSYEEKGVSIVE